MKKTFVFTGLIFLFSTFSFAKEKVENLVLSTSDGWRISCRYSAPQKDKLTIVLVHSLGKDKNDWNAFADRLADKGYGYASLDLRGHGLSNTNPAGEEISYRNFDREGTDNEFNHMTRDVEAVLKYLNKKGIPNSEIVLMGGGIGANVSIKTAALYPDIKMIAVLTPTLNANRDVLSVNPLRVYGQRPILIAASKDNARIFREVMLLRNVAAISAGEGNVTFLVDNKGDGLDLIQPWSTREKIFQWLLTPQLPPKTLEQPELLDEGYYDVNQISDKGNADEESENEKGEEKTFANEEKD
jgi:pimeloyl-ACP methyl ester carboxylesterase